MSVLNLEYKCDNFESYIRLQFEGPFTHRDCDYNFILLLIECTGVGGVVTVVSHEHLH